MTLVGVDEQQLAAHVLAIRWTTFLVPALAALAAVLVLNRDFYRFLACRRGAAFALASIPLHLLYFVCSGIGFVYARAGHALGVRAGTLEPPRWGLRSGALVSRWTRSHVLTESLNPPRRRRRCGHRIRELAAARPRFRYRRTHALLGVKRE